MITRELTVRNPSGLHARPAAIFAETAGGFESSVTVRNITSDGSAVDAKSILMVLTLGVQQGHRIAVSAEGSDEELTISTLAELIASNLGETGEG